MRSEKESRLCLSHLFLLLVRFSSGRELSLMAPFFPNKNTLLRQGMYVCMYVCTFAMLVSQLFETSLS